MIVKVERSGGLTGIPILTEIDAKDLPSSLIITAKKIMVDQELSVLPMKVTPRGAADYYSYKISVRDGVNQKVIECNEYNIHDDIKLLVKFIERNSKKGK